MAFWPDNLEYIDGGFGFGFGFLDFWGFFVEGEGLERRLGCMWRGGDKISSVGKGVEWVGVVWWVGIWGLLYECERFC